MARPRPDQNRGYIALRRGDSGATRRPADAARLQGDLLDRAVRPARTTPITRRRPPIRRSRRTSGRATRRRCSRRCAPTGRRSRGWRGACLSISARGARPAGRLLRGDDRPADQHAAADLLSALRAAHRRTGQLRAGVHTDSTCSPSCTPTPIPAGCEVRAREARGSAVGGGRCLRVNVGDILMRWTNDHWVSTPHRVANPPDGWGERRHLDPVLLPGQLRHGGRVPAAGEAPKYPPVSVGAYRAERFAKTAG